MKYKEDSAPNLIKAISLIWVLTGVIFILIAIWGFSMSGIFNQISGFKSGNSSSVGYLNILYQVIHNAIPISVYSLLFGGLGIISALYLKRMRKWALYTLLVMSWMTVVKILVFVIFWILIWKSIFVDVPPNMSMNLTGQFIGLFLFIIAALAYIVIMLAVIKKLDSKSVKSIF